MYRVEIHGVSNGEDALIGYVLLDGDTLSVLPEIPELEDILEEPIFMADGTDLYAKDDPKKFMENLSRHYRGTGMRASELQESV